MGDSKCLSKADLARIERNRQRALLLRSSIASKQAVSNDSCLVQEDARTIDSGGGFLLEFDDTTDEQLKSIPNNITYEDDVDLTETHKCQDCGTTFNESFLLRQFIASVCDACRNKNEKNKLITKTDAKSCFLLKDYDFENRGKTLQYISKKNPHNPFSGEMKLYFKPQVVDLAKIVWGTLEKLEEEKAIRKVKSDKMRHKKLEKRVKELRRAVRTSTWHKDTKLHEHEFGEETYDEESDMFSKTCTTCGHVVEFEKM